MKICKLLGVSAIKELGRGLPSAVLRRRLMQSSNNYHLSSLSESKKCQASKEAEILKKIDHSHVIKYYGSVVDDNVMYILMECAAYGDHESSITETKRKIIHISEN